MNAIISQSGSLTLLQRLGESGRRIVDQADIKELLPEYSSAYVNQLLHTLGRNGWLLRLRRGLYALSPDIFQGPPLHEFELGMALADQAAISHWSALSVHGLTEQIPQEVFLTTTDTVTLPRDRRCAGQVVDVLGHTFRFCREAEEQFFGFQTIWRSEAAIRVTDPERTLLDGLARPQLCGDFGVVWQAFEQHLGQLNLERIVSYARRLGVTAEKRLGWVLERQGLTHSLLEELARSPIRGYRPLDPTAERRGPCNSHWHIIENLPGNRR